MHLNVKCVPTGSPGYILHIFILVVIRDRRKLVSFLLFVTNFKYDEYNSPKIN